MEISAKCGLEMSGIRFPTTLLLQPLPFTLFSKMLSHKRLSRMCHVQNACESSLTSDTPK